MDLLKEQQRKRALEVMNEYIFAPRGAEGKTPVEASGELDRNRAKLIEEQLKPLVADYLARRVGLANSNPRWME